MYRNPLQHRGAPFSGGGEDEFYCWEMLCEGCCFEEDVAEAFAVAAAAVEEDYCMGVLVVVVERGDG